MQFKGPRQNVGTKATDESMSTSLLEEIAHRGPRLSVSVRPGGLSQGARTGATKIGAKEANYTEDDVYPFCCGNCIYIVWGRSEYDYCQIVEGPHPDGGISPKDTCRLFRAKPNLGA